MGKKDKTPKKEEAEDSDDEAGPVVEVGPFCEPIAEAKLAKKLFKCIKKGTLATVVRCCLPSPFTG